MKKLMILIIAVIVSRTGFSQVMLPSDTTAKVNKVVHQQPDRIKMKDNKIWVIKNNEKAELTTDITLTDGTIVMKDGTVKAPDGTTTMMKNGDCIYMNGQWRKNKKDNGKE